MQRRRSKSVLPAFLGLLVAAVPTLAETYYVRPAGNDDADGKTAGTAFRTVLRAAGVLDHGDSLVIGPGQYKDSALIAERFSADGAEMSITGDESGKLTGDAAGTVTITPTSATSAALSFHRLANLRIKGLTFDGPGQGLKLDNCRGVTVERCTFDGLTRGLAVHSSEAVTVRSCVVERCAIGLYFQGSVKTQVSQVTVAGSSAAGLLALTCGEGQIRNSLFAANNSNLIGDGISAKAWSSDYNVITGTCGSWGDEPAEARIHEWFAASGQDRHSVYVAPAFKDADRFDLHVSPEVTWPGGLPGMNIGLASQDKAPPLDRDGKAFRVRDGRVCAGAYDYPDPAPGKGWAKLPVKIEGKGPRQSAGIYRDDGTLVRMLLADAAGVNDLYWDGLNDVGDVVPEGKYVAKVAAHDVQLVDDGAFGDNGNAVGMYNFDNANRVAPLADGGFFASAFYDEGCYPVRRYSSSGQPTFAAGLLDTEFAALVSVGDDDLYAVVGKGAATKLVRLALPGERAKMPNGADSYSVFAGDDKDATVAGLAVSGGAAYIAIAGKNIVRVIDLAAGQKKGDLPVPNVGDIAADAKGNLWVLTGNEIATLSADGKMEKRFASTLDKPMYLAAGKDRLCVVDQVSERVAVLDFSGKVIQAMGKPRPIGQFVPVSTDYWRMPRGACFLKDGRLVVCEYYRIRILNPETGKVLNEILSNFVDTVRVHPVKGEYVISSLGIFRVDPKTGAWKWLLESPRWTDRKFFDGAKWSTRPEGFGAPMETVVLGGRPFVAYWLNESSMRMVDVSDPLHPRLALNVMWEKAVTDHQAWFPKDGTLQLVDDPTMRLASRGGCFAKDGSILSGWNAGDKGDTPTLRRIPFKGLDEKNNPVFDWAHSVLTPTGAEKLKQKMAFTDAGVTVDASNDDVYFGGMTAQFNECIPAFFRGATGVGKLNPQGKPLWFSRSSGGNYLAAGAINDGKNSYVLATKILCGQVDVFDADGLRLATSNWSWPTHYISGWVDCGHSVTPYLRPDGKIGAYVEDDGIGRLNRIRMDGADTIRKTSAAIDWKPTGAVAGPVPRAEVIAGKGIETIQVVPKVPELKLDGDWKAWAGAGVVPQIVALPVLNFKHCTMPDDLWQTFKTGTAVGAIAHDGKSLYVYFVVACDGMHFDAEGPGGMPNYDGIEFWAEEEQFGLGFTKDGAAQLYKYRFHDQKGAPYAKSYALPKENVWGVKLEDLSAHPLGRQLGEIAGVSFKNKRGYAVMGRIPFADIKLVSGIAGRDAKDVLELKGEGDILRLGVNFDGILTWGHGQDFKVGWPMSLMFGDPTRSAPFVLGK